MRSGFRLKMLWMLWKTTASKREDEVTYSRNEVLRKHPSGSIHNYLAKSECILHFVWQCYGWYGRRRLRRRKMKKWLKVRSCHKTSNVKVWIIIRQNSDQGVRFTLSPTSYERIFIDDLLKKATDEELVKWRGFEIIQEEAGRRPPWMKLIPLDFLIEVDFAVCRRGWSPFPYYTTVKSRLYVQVAGPKNEDVELTK